MLRPAALVGLAAVCLACGASNDPLPSGGATIDDPRAASLAGTGSVDVAIVDAKGDFAAAHDLSWYELELRLLDDDPDVTTGTISSDESTKVVVDFWAHGADGSVRAEGRLAIDVTRWLGLSVERNPEDIAAIFDGSRVSEAGAPVSVEARDAYLSAVLDAMADDSLVPPAMGKLLKIKTTDSLGTCASGVKKALSSISATFKTCSSCAAHAVDDPTSDATWAACDTCEKSITDAKSAVGLLDLLSCKKALVFATGSGDPDDAGGPLVKIPDGVVPSTCYESSADKVHGTFRVTDGKGSVSCTDCPAGTTPVDTKLGCAPKSEDPYSPVDESRALVMVPAGKGNPGTPRIMSSDVCVVVDVTATGTVNGNPVEAGPRRAIYKLGDRGWAALPKNAKTSKDQWDLTSDTHSGATRGSYEIGATSSAKKPAPASANSVEEAIARGGCSSRPVFGLAQQVAEEVARCVRPGLFVRVPSGGALTNAADLQWLEKPAAEALDKAVKARPGHTLHASSMYRTIAQQYFLYRRAACFPAVASPGRSNHETGIAVDVSDPDNATWRSTLESVGFKWLGSFDRFHFDYKGAGSLDTRGDDVKAFQRLWNRNHPDDKIGEDGAWGPETEKRLKAAPAGGFPIGVPDSCEAAATVATSKGSRQPFSYLTNVTTADLLPGDGCEKGSDASHSSVDACVSVKQVCQPYWCDLADQRTDACR